MLLVTNLMGVKSEKEPLTGTAPVNLLFDRSLYNTWQEVWYHILVVKLTTKETEGNTKSS